MSRPRNKRATGSNQPRETRQPALSLATAERMLPLVSQIVADIRACWKRLTELEAEQADLERRRHGLDWPQRARRYQIGDEVASEQQRLQGAVGELEELQVVLVDPVAGEAAFPTVVNGRRGYFVWKTGEAVIAAWCYAHDTARRPIPENWRAKIS